MGQIYHCSEWPGVLILVCCMKLCQFIRGKGRNRAGEYH